MLYRMEYTENVEYTVTAGHCIVKRTTTKSLPCVLAVGGTCARLLVHSRRRQR